MFQLEFFFLQFFNKMFPPQVDRDVTEAAPPSGPQQDVLSLATLQNLLCKQYGEAHFNAQEQPLLYATVSD